MRITRIEPQKARRVKLQFEDGGSLLLPEKEFKLLLLEEGDELPEEMYDRILEVILLPEAKKKAMDYLVRQDRSEGELYQKLLAKGFPEKVCEGAIAYVKSFHYLDDARYARNYIDLKKNSKSRYEITMELKRRKVASEVIEAAFCELDCVDDSCAIRNLIRKRYPQGTGGLDRKDEQKLIAYLARKGFSFEDIRREMSIE